MNFVPSSFNKSILNSPLSLACYYRDGNNFKALFCFQCSFKSAYYFNYSSVELLQLEIAFSQFQFLGIKVTSLLYDLHMKNYVIQFYFSLVFVGVFIAYISAFSLGRSIFSNLSIFL